MPIDGIVRAVNLLPPDFAGAPKATGDQGARPEVTGGAGPFVVLGVLAACVAGAAGYVLTNNTIEQRKADVNALQAQKKVVDSQTAQLRPFADFGTIANQRVATVRDLATSRFDWEQVLRDLSRAIPADVSLKDISGDLSQSTGGAGGSSSVRGAIAAPAITLHGCAPGQTQVARLMARLHSVDGVTRVSLTKSDNAVATAGGDQASELAARNQRPCGAGKRPQFEVVAFFEDAPAAVKTATNTSGTGAQPGATPTPTPTPAGDGTATATPTATPDGTSTTASTSSQGGATP
jgi:Tfp pilus assembly protein PilN